jgi:uncharacterized membrane protein YhaH (DUF805 family)
VTFGDSVRKCFRKYGTFKGRASRSEYWWFTLLTFLFAWPLLLSQFDSALIYRVLQYLYFLLTLAVIVPAIAVWVRRMHDTGRSGWVWLWGLIPIIGTLLLIRWASQSGDAEINKYGDPDNEPFTPAGIQTAMPPEPTEIDESEKVDV